MTDDRTRPDQGARGGPEWPMAPGVPGSANAREARTIVGLPPDASDSEFVGASPAEGRDALVSAARRRLEPVLAAHGLNSRESWLVDHELKSALGRLLVGVPAQPLMSQRLAAHPHSAAAQPQHSAQRPQPPEKSAPQDAPPPRRAPQPQDAEPSVARAAAPSERDVATALYLRRSPLGRAMLARTMQAPGAAGDASAIAPHGSSGHLGEPHVDDAHLPEARRPGRRRSRARVIAATIAVLSAIGLVIEIAYVPVHLQRARAAKQAAEPSQAGAGSATAPSRVPVPAPRDAPVPAAQPDAGGASASPAGDTRTADRTSADASPSEPADRTKPAPRPAPIPSPALSADQAPEGQVRPSAAPAETVDPSLRQRIDALAAHWWARANSSIDAQRTIAAVDSEPLRWLAQARLLERLIALDDIAQLLIEARADDAAPLLDVMPVQCNLAAQPSAGWEETSSREDGRLVTDLSRAGGGGESRLAVLRAYRSLPLSPGRADARALVSEALSGPSRNSRALALAILLERGPTSVAVLEAVHARANELAANSAARAVVEQLAGELPGGAQLDAQSLRARLARRILEGRGAPMHVIDATSDATAAMLDRMARRADPQVAPADMESSLATLARAASRDAAPARLDGASGPIQRMVASLTALEGARVVRNYRRLPEERPRIDAAAAATSARILASGSSLGQAIEAAIGLLAQDCITLRAPELPISSVGESPAASAQLGTPNPLLLPAPAPDAMSRWPEAARVLASDGASAQDAEAILRIAEDVQDSASDDQARSLAARLYARAAIAGSEGTAASAARGIASLVPESAGPHAAERHRWESIAAQYATADASARGIGRVQRRASSGADAEADASSRAALADAIALCLSGSGRQATDRLQSPTVRALAQRLSGALPGGIEGLESLCEGRTPGSPPLDLRVAEQLLCVEAALRDARSMRWSDDLALRRGLPLVSVDTASRAARARLFTPAPAPGPQ